MNNPEKILSREIETDRTPSLQYYFFDLHDILYSFEKGFADIAGQRKTSPETTYNAYSVTKTFTSLAILQLAEKGKIDISKPVIHYLHEFRYGSEITVKQLLNHTAGIPNPIPLSWIHTESEHNAFDRNSIFKQVFNKHNKVKSKPNGNFAYTNLGYIVLGQLIEQISGKTYEDYVYENIIAKLPVSPGDLTFNIPDRRHHAKGYHKVMSLSNILLGFFIDKSRFMGENEGKWRPFKRFYVNGTSYGGIAGKPYAFIKFIQELLKENNCLISDTFRQLLFMENKNNKGENTGMCLGWFTGTLNGVQYFAHAGGGGGYYCEIRLYPDIKNGSVIFFNRTGLKDERYLDRPDKFFVNKH
jgi:D-alanyl-D-alanine carboxypeptidase